MSNIEVEIRSFITKEQYDRLLDFFNKEGELVCTDNQETFYFSGQEDLRIQKNNYFSKVWLKKGKIHDEFREQIEIKFEKEDFDRLASLFLSLGFEIAIKWYRTRHVFKWQDIDVSVDYTKGYGYIIELEKMTTDEGKEKILDLLKQKMQLLDIPLTPREDFDKKYQEYKENWQKIIENHI